MSMKNSNDTGWNRTSDLPICSTAPKPLKSVHVFGLIIEMTKLLDSMLKRGNEERR